MKKIFLSIDLIFIPIIILAQSTSITIDALHPGADISKNLYGIFFEEINHAGEGGIYGELIMNSGFEANRLPENMIRKGNFVVTKQGWKHYYPQPDSLTGWTLIKKGESRGYIQQVSENPLNPNNPMSMKIELYKLGNGEFGIVNKGYWGISLIKGQNYNLSFYARSDGKFKGDAEVILQNDSGKIISKKIIKGIDPKWEKFNCVLNASETEPKSSFVFKPLSEGTLWIDMVSLFPEKTYKLRNNGLRLDLAQKIEDFKPGFIRFPGGCIVEGATLANRVKWKNTIGNVANRPGHWVLWDYYSSDGLGFHEFLQFCEDLKCPAMYVLSIGMSCQFRKTEIVDTAKLRPYIDEVLDALEYALGPVTSVWGAERAKNGHPEPFNLKYVEIGNENYGFAYQEHYNYFYKAIKAKYPKINTIACTDPGMRDAFKLYDLSKIKEPIEMIDEHFYESPDFFYKNAYRYDNYDRKGPKIYVGEYAVKKWGNNLKGNLDAALAEAAFMTGFERNADIVQISSQAPTFVNDNDRTWNPDLLVYNSSQSFGTPSYQVQKLFSNNVPDKILTTRVNNSGFRINRPEKGAGMVGLYNTNDYCHYKDIKVKLGKNEYSSNNLFTNETIKTSNGGSWSVDKSQYLELKFKPEIYKSAETSGWNDFTLSLKAKADTIDDIEGFTIIFYTTGQNKHYKWHIGRWNRYYWLQWYDNGYESYFGQQPGSIEVGKWYDISISIKGDSVYCYLDGKQIHAVKTPELVTPGIYATSGINNNGEIIIKVVNPTDESRQIPVSVNGSTIIYRKVHAEIITGERYSENSFSEPLKISLKSLDFTIPGNNFSYTFQPRSVIVLTLKQ